MHRFFGISFVYTKMIRKLVRKEKIMHLKSLGIIMSLCLILFFSMVAAGQSQTCANCKTSHACAASGVTEKQEAGNQEICPVMGGKINKEVYTDYNGKRIYFCCAGCEKTFLKDPQKYMKAMNDQGVVLEDASCPVSEKTAKADVMTEFKGRTYYFCCDGCKTAFLDSPEKYIKK